MVEGVGMERGVERGGLRMEGKEVGWYRAVVLNLFQYMHPFQISSQFSHPPIAEIQKNTKNTKLM